MQTHLDAGSKGFERVRRTSHARLSPQMEMFKRKLMEWLTDNKEQEAMGMFRVRRPYLAAACALLTLCGVRGLIRCCLLPAQRLMREGLVQGGGRTLPAEYRPDAHMLDEYYRTLIR